MGVLYFWNYGEEICGGGGGLVVVWVWKVVENISDGFCYDLGLGPCVGFCVCGMDLDQMTRPISSLQATNNRESRPFFW